MPGGLPTFELSRLDGQTIEDWRNHGIVFLIGSLVSTYSPTNLSLGKAISSALCKWLFAGFPDWLIRDVERLPFEALMECYPDQGVLPSIVKAIFSFSARKPNKVHSALVSRLQEGNIEGLITTNYDLGFEACLRGDPRVSVVDDRVSYRRFRSCDWKPRLCLKLHGSAKDGKEHTLVYRLTQEGRLQKWKKELLEELLKDRVLVVVGYSGCDFDICPTLAWDTRQHLTVWLRKPGKDKQHNGEAQPNPKRVLEKRAGFFLIGNFLEFLSTMLGENLTDCTSCDTPWRPQDYFRENLVKQWRLQVLNWIACGKLGRDYLSDFEGDDVARRKFQAAICGHLGFYHDAIRELEANLAEPGLSEDQRLDCRIDLAGARFIYGQHLRGWPLLVEVEKSIAAASSLSPERRKELEIKALETKMMMSMRMAQLLRLVRCAWLLTRWKEEIRQQYEDARLHLEEVGQWGRLEALQINAERIGVARQEGLPLPSREGFRSLGLISMEVIAARDLIRSSPGKLTEEMEKMANSCLEQAENYGWNHEAWKFQWILLWRGRRHKTRYLKGWWKHFWKTQYAPLARIFHLAASLFPVSKEG